MLSPFDDQPIHQTSAPVLHLATSDPNAAERFDFAGFDPATGVLFGATLGLYPHRGVVDAAFSVTVDGHQHSVHASGRLEPGSRPVSIGPVSVDLVVPMHTVRLQVHGPAATELGLAVDLTFVAGTTALELPRHLEHRDGSVVGDTTSFVQLGSWSGTVTVDGTPVLAPPLGAEAGSGESGPPWPGRRSRSWGVEPLGGRPTAPAHELPQRFWAATTVWLGAGGVVTAVDERADGRRTYQFAERLDPAPGHPIGPADPSTPTLRDLDHHVEWQPGTRWARSTTVHLTPWSGAPVQVQLEPVTDLALAGLGPVSASWPHGAWNDELAVGRDSWVLADLDPLDVHHLARWQLCRADTGDATGWGLVEHLAVGPHAPSGLTGFTDGAGSGATP